MLPGGGIAEIRVRDGGNCFNVNSVVDGRPGERLTRRPSGVLQFTGLMMALEVPRAGRAADRRGGGGLGRQRRAARPRRRRGRGLCGRRRALPHRQHLVRRSGRAARARRDDARNLRAARALALRACRPAICRRSTSTPWASIRRPCWRCSRPASSTSPRARRVLAQRPSNGWGNQVEFWRLEAMSELNVPLDVQLQPQLKTRWFTLDVRVELMGGEYQRDGAGRRPAPALADRGAALGGVTPAPWTIFGPKRPESPSPRWGGVGVGWRFRKGTDLHRRHPSSPSKGMASRSGLDWIEVWREKEGPG